MGEGARWHVRRVPVGRVPERVDAGAERGRGVTRTTTLADDEIAALDALLAALRRGAHSRDLALLVASAPMTSVARKVGAMRGSMERQRELGLRVIEARGKRS